MNKIIKYVLLLVLSIIMAVSSLVVVGAEEIKASESDNGVAIISVSDSDGSRAYELVWRYKSEYGHLWKRRWNATLGAWYDPDWILVY